MLAVMLCGACGPTLAAAPAVTPDQTSSALPPSAAEVAADAVVGVSGFRSALFGMSQADVKAAIIKDFSLKPEAILTGENAAERTQVLTALVPNLLDGGGTAQVSYIFGYKTKGLIQVGISWSHATDTSITPDELYADGDVLRSHFMNAGYKPDSVKTGLVLPNGLLLFRGEDADGHATILILQGSFKASSDGKQRTLTPSALALLYSASPENPDVFKLAPGQF